MTSKKEPKPKIEQAPTPSTPLRKTLTQQLTDREPYKSGRRPEAHAFASEAMNCSRKIALRIWHRADPVPERESKLSGLLALRIGERVHDMLQSALLAAYPHAQIELTWDLPFISGRVDGVYETEPGNPSTRTVVEIKSMSAIMFNRAHKNNRPDIGHLMQAVLGAFALKAPFVHLIYVSKAARPNEEAMMEWVLPVSEELEAFGGMSAQDYGEMEQERLATIVQEAELGKIPQPMYQGELILNPDKKYWPCGFCLWSEECKALGPQEVTLPLSIYSEEELT